MNNIEQYKKRFYNLMESTMGDVRPIISEQPVRQSTPPTNPPRPGTPSRTSTTTTPPPSNPKMSDSQYFVSQVMMSDTIAVLDKFRGKTLYLYNELGECKNEGGKNKVFIGGKEALPEMAVNSIPYEIISTKFLTTENEQGYEVPTISDGKLTVIFEFISKPSLVKDTSGGAPNISYNKVSEPEKNDFSDQEEDAPEVFNVKGKVNTHTSSGDKQMAWIKYDLNTKKWFIDDYHSKEPKNSCLLKLLQTQLPDGMVKLQKSDTDLGYTGSGEEQSRA
jgi:hypothetical protein